MKKKSNLDGDYIMKEIFKDFKYNVLILVAFFTSLLFIYSTYAWFSSTLDVDITFFKLTAGTNTGLSFSLDGVNWSNSITLSKEAILDNLRTTYPNNTNQWSSSLPTVSSVGIYNGNRDKFTFVGGKYTSTDFISSTQYYYINSYYLNEDRQSSDNKFIAFDLFFRNISNSPSPDNLYLSKTTSFIDSSLNDNIAVNSVRLGFVFYDTISRDASVSAIQNLGCSRTGCRDLIFEPNSTRHTASSIKIASDHGITLKDGDEYPTYAMIKEAKKVNIWSGVHDSDVEYDDSLFLYQGTRKDYNEAISKIPDGILKVRVYLWIEASDIDVISTDSEGYKITVNLDFEKDLSGYDGY